jgi:putative cardiolipin synthase
MAECTSVPIDYLQRIMSIPPAADSGLERELRPILEEHPGQSGFALLQHGPAALLARAVLADLAAMNVDVQYYIYEEDLSGVLLTQRLLDAADRGVRVRVLLDDNNLRGSDFALKLLAHHANIEIRVFNPYRTRARWFRPIELVLNFERLQRRMHNKVFAVDGVTGIFGGRNVGDNYFGAHRDANFSDFDVFVAGPLIEEACSSFEAYWGHRLAVPVEEFTEEEVTEEEFEQGRRRLQERLGAVEDLEERYDRARAQLIGMMEDPEETLTFAAAEFVADPPEKLDPAYAQESPVLKRLLALWDEAEREVLIESAYFVPSRKASKFIRQQAREGAETRLLTNSLAANDVLPVHAGYVKHRRRLLKAGIGLYEFRHRHAQTGEEDIPLAGKSSDASLHAKVAVFDRRVTWVGSFNLDQRSAELNTELGIAIHSDQLAGEAAAMIERDLEPDRSWRLGLEPRLSAGLGIVWYGLRDGRMIRLTEEPDATRLQRLAVNLLKLVPGLDRLL